MACAQNNNPKLKEIARKRSLCRKAAGMVAKATWGIVNSNVSAPSLLQLTAELIMVSLIFNSSLQSFRVGTL